jgi:hypothetical protein
MKNVKFISAGLIAMVICAGFSSCSDDKHEESEIVGKWTFSSSDFNRESQELNDLKEQLEEAETDLKEAL